MEMEMKKENVKIKINGKEYKIKRKLINELGLSEALFAAGCERADTDDVDIDNLSTEYIIVDAINIENEQKKIRKIIDKEDKYYYNAELELTITNDYYDWRNTIADNVFEKLELYFENNESNKTIENFRNESEYNNELINNYNELINQYNKYGELELLNNDTIIDEEMLNKIGIF